MNASSPGLAARLFVGLQHLIPQHLLSALMYRLARCTWPPLRWALVHGYLGLIRVDMTQAVEPNPDAYPSLNALFTRALRPDVRPMDPDPDTLVCPVDGTLSQASEIRQGRIIQAKGHDYSVSDLLGPGDDAEGYEGGWFATIYLSPKDYHRIHMPLSGRLCAMTHVPGRLFSVNALTTQLVPGLFARNERVVCAFETAGGPMVMVLVGAIFVGGIETVWAGEITPAKAARHQTDPTESAVTLKRGEEMGRFNLGSTVVLLFPPGMMAWDPARAPGDEVRLGQRIGRLLTPTNPI